MSSNVNCNSKHDTMTTAKRVPLHLSDFFSPKFDHWTFKIDSRKKHLSPESFTVFWSKKPKLDGEIYFLAKKDQI
ncbi:hypothetical protein BpHYR1_017587 [Brachionus plicatilis]|uniref:Uncharacterized protein n=1 Tax=Brachionus plicatilis TaxID=10195 RepID=A0A3M7SD69_BRAPC|nr:hypothetical protein BpHYR1_017587 [Brachionus plicatilis]